jgi:hypothetical protein
MASARQAEDFSRAFLNGERGWCIVSMIKVFMDETNTHDAGEMIAVGAYIARPSQWGKWTKDWNVHKRRVPAGRNPINVFHSTDCQNYRDEFEGWNIDERNSYVAQLLPVLPAHHLAGIVIGIHRPSLEQEFKKHPELKEMFGEPYEACFQWALTTLVQYATERGNGERMAFVHEVNHYKQHAFRALEYVREFKNPRKIPITLAFGTKEDYPPLQAADVLAFEGGKFLKNPDLPLNFHPAAIRASTDFTRCGASGATCDRLRRSGLRRRSHVAERLAA